MPKRMRRISSRSDVARRTPRCVKRLQPHFCTLLLQDSPGDLVDRDAILAHDQRIGIPQMLRTEHGPALINRTHRIADSDLDLLANHGKRIEICDSRIASASMQILGRSTTPYMFFIAKVTPDIL